MEPSIRASKVQSELKLTTTLLLQGNGYLNFITKEVEKVTQKRTIIVTTLSRVSKEEGEKSGQKHIVQ